MKAQLEKAIDKYFAPLAQKYGFALKNEEAYGMGALKDYSAENVLVRVVNDRGIVSFEIAPLSDRDRRFDIAIYKEYLNPPKQGVLNLSLQQQADFLKSHWEWLNDKLSPAKAKATLAEIEEAARRRSERLLGSSFSRDPTP